jgi:hypothetical protein
LEISGGAIFALAVSKKIVDKHLNLRGIIATFFNNWSLVMQREIVWD